MAELFLWDCPGLRGVRGDRIGSGRVRAQIGTLADSGLSPVHSAAYGYGALIWVGYLLAPTPAPQYVDVVRHNEVEKWNQALLEIVER